VDNRQQFTAKKRKHMRQISFPDTEEVTGFKSSTAHDFSNVCLAGGAKRGAQGGARSQADPLFFWRFKIEFMAVAPVSMTGRSWCL
jgi:hypothetical protein